MKRIIKQWVLPRVHSRQCSPPAGGCARVGIPFLVSPIAIFNLLIILFFTVYCSLFPVTQVNASDMDSTQFRIRSGNIDIGGENNFSSSGYKLGATLGQTAAEEFNSAGYTVKAGFQYIHSIIPFTFSLSNTLIDLGQLLPNIPNTGTTSLKVSFGLSGNYQVTAIEEQPLKISGGSGIPDTGCDSSACSEDTASPWTSNSVTGFGYNISCTGITAGVPCSTAIPATFKGCGGSDCPTYYRRFPDRSAAESPRVVMSNNDVTLYSTSPSSDPNRNTHQTMLTFKANVDAAQQAGSYNTVINFVATPSY